MLADRLVGWVERGEGGVVGGWVRGWAAAVDEPVGSAGGET